MTSSADFYDQYGAAAAPYRQALGFGLGQSDIPLLHPGDPAHMDDGPQFLPQIQQLMSQGVISQTPNDESGGTSGTPYQVQWDKLPSTRFGSGEAVSAYDPSMHLLNPNLKYNDPQYGWITPTANVDTRGSKWEEAIYQFAPAMFLGGIAGMAGLGAAGSAMIHAPGYAHTIENMFGNGSTHSGSTGQPSGGQAGGGTTRGGNRPGQNANVGGLLALLLLLSRGHKG